MPCMDLFNSYGVLYEEIEALTPGSRVCIGPDIPAVVDAVIGDTKFRVITEAGDTVTVTHGGIAEILS